MMPLQIPSADVRPVDARESPIVARLRSIKPSRRSVLRGLAVAATASVLTPAEWYFSRREARAAGPKEEFLTCEPVAYDEEANNWPVDGKALCYGAFLRGAFPCMDGWHREGTYHDSTTGGTYVSERLSTTCEGRNAWRWAGHRCSDAWTTAVYPNGDFYEGVTISACVL